MPFISLDQVSIAFGLQPLLDRTDFQIDPGERICLIGRNGAGKSTLLKLIADELQPDTGAIWRQTGLRIARLAQDPLLDEQATVFELVAGGLPEIGRLLNDYHAAAHGLATTACEASMARVERLQHELEARDGWNLNQRVESVLSRLQLPADERLETLSGGWRRRVALARVLVVKPDLLLLDEPTNHLDIEAIQWLEEQLLDYRGAILFVTHDRALLQRLATRIVELDRGHLHSWPGDYRDFLEKKAAALEEEARHNALFTKKLAREEAWIRQGIQARRTRNEGRVRALQALRAERKARRSVEGKAKLALDEAERSGKQVIEAERIHYAWDDTPIVRDFSVRILRGDRIGLIGPNGAGKTTLLRLLLGQLQPDSGTVRLGTKLEIAYFDQLRARLDPTLSVIDTVAEGREYLRIQGSDRHIISYLQDFLFTPERARTPVGSLSGGERNRLLLARLFSQPANLLVMDEPTNDLDIETLELLEELLMGFGGTLLLVSHDRQFLDNVITSTLVFEGGGRVREYVGGYSDWLAQRPPPTSTTPVRTNSKLPPARSRPAARPGYQEKRELAQLPGRIETLETEQEQLNRRISDPAFYQGDPTERDRVLRRLTRLQDELTGAYERWEQLEGR